MKSICFNREKSRRFSTIIIGLLCTTAFSAADLGQERSIGKGLYPHCAIDAQGTLHIVYWNSGAKYRTMRANGELSPPEDILLIPTLFHHFDPTLFLS